VDPIQKYAPLLGRALIAVLFVPAGFRKIEGFEGTVKYITSKALPFPEILAAGTLSLEMLGGLALLVGFKARYAALALAVFTLLAAVFFHNYWAVPEAQKMAQYLSFYKNMAIAGGLLCIAAMGAGPFSYDNRSPKQD